jgi:hypothetical protein
VCPAFFACTATTNIEINIIQHQNQIQSNVTKVDLNCFGNANECGRNTTKKHKAQNTLDWLECFFAQVPRIGKRQKEERKKQV